MRWVVRPGQLGCVPTAAIYQRFGPLQPHLLSALHTRPPPHPDAAPQALLPRILSRQKHKLANDKRWRRPLQGVGNPLPPRPLSSLPSEPKPPLPSSASSSSSSFPPPPPHSSSSHTPLPLPPTPEAGKDGKRPPNLKRELIGVVVVGLAVGVFFLYVATPKPPTWRPTDEQLSPKDSRDALNDQSFVPFKIVAREDVSPNAFVLTVRLASKTDPDKEPSKASRKLTRQRMDEAWRHGLWSVEVKQPQLQIARDYTPLPEVDGTYADGDGDGDGDTHMRLFVRVVPGGEVSRYLSRLAVGSRIGLRGPRRSFDVVARLGESGKKTNGHSQQSELSEFRDDSAPVPDPETEEPKKMVVLAGGTGVATALQAADAALRALPTVSVTVLWANRLPYDGAGLKAEANLGANNTNNTRNPIVRDIRALQARYGADRLQVQSFVDAENTRITEADVRKAIGAKEPETSWFRPWRKEPQRLTSTMPTEEVDRWAEVHRENAACAYHSYSLLVRRSSDPWRNPNSPTPACSCREAKDLILVSGPEGFIEAWAGPKTWMSGKERQGTVDGILRRMAVQDPQTFSKWQVLKL